MHPILFQIGPLRLSTYGLLVATAMIVGILFITRETRREGENPDVMLDLCYYIVIAALVGSRLLYVMINYDIYLRDPLAILKVWEGGLVFYGGLIAALLVSAWFVRKHRLNFFRLGDTVILAVPLGHAVGRLGCFFAGCCYGKYAPHLPWAITFSDPASLAPKNIPLHPTQIYSSLAGVLAFVILLGIKRWRRFEGQVFASFLILYPLTRIFLERFRGDVARKFLPIPGQEELISTGDVISFILLIIGIGLYVFLKRRARPASP